MFSRVKRRGDRHGWNNLNNFLKVHDRRLADLKPEFVVGDNLTYQRVSPGVFRIAGRIFCHHGLFLAGVKILEVNAANRAQTRKYTYYAGGIGKENRPIFGYDNAHGYHGHDDDRHKHRYVHQQGPELWNQFKPPI